MIQRETWGMGPYAGADFNLTLSHSRRLSQLSTPKRWGLGGWEGFSYWLRTFVFV